MIDVIKGGETRDLYIKHKKIIKDYEDKKRNQKR